MLPLIDFAAVFLTGLMVGNEFAVAAFIHPALSRLQPSAHLAAAKPIAALLGRIMPFWYAAGLLLLGELWLRRTPHASSYLLLIIAASLWALTILFTLLTLAPLNNRIAAVDLRKPCAGWQSDRATWDKCHRLRVAVLATAFALLLIAIRPSF